MGLWRGPTLRSLIDVLDRVIGRGVVIDSDVPVSPALAGLRRAVAARDSPELLTPADSAASPGAWWWDTTVSDSVPVRSDARSADRQMSDPPSRDGAPAD